jgi:hypothetical protein
MPLNLPVDNTEAHAQVMADTTAFDAFCGLAAGLMPTAGLNAGNARNHNYFLTQHMYGWQISYGPPDGTAFTDYDTKTISVPWPGENISPEQYNNLRAYVLHELGHIRHTDLSVLRAVMSRQQGWMPNLFNILEDIRINHLLVSSMGLDKNTVDSAFDSLWAKLAPQINSLPVNMPQGLAILNDVISHGASLKRFKVKEFTVGKLQAKLTNWMNKHLPVMRGARDSGEIYQLAQAFMKEFEKEMGDYPKGDEDQQQQQKPSKQQKPQGQPQPTPSKKGDKDSKEKSKEKKEKGKAEKGDEGEDGEGDSDEGEDGEGEGDAKGESDGEGEDGEAGEGSGEGEAGEGDGEVSDAEGEIEGESSGEGGGNGTSGGGTQSMTIDQLRKQSLESSASNSEYAVNPANKPKLNKDERQALAGIVPMAPFTSQHSRSVENEMRDYGGADAMPGVYAKALRRKGARCAALVRQAFAAKSRFGDMCDQDDGELDPDKMPELARGKFESPFYVPGRVIHDRNTAVAINLDGSSSMLCGSGMNPAQVKRLETLDPRWRNLQGQPAVEFLANALPHLDVRARFPNAAAWSQFNSADYMANYLTTTRIPTTAGALAVHDALRGARVAHEISAFIDNSHAVLKPFAKPKLNPLGREYERMGGLAAGGTPAAGSWKLAIGALLARREARKVLIVMTDGGVDDPTACQALLNVARKAGVEVYGLGLGDDAIANLFPGLHRKACSVCLGGDDLTLALVDLIKRILTKASA